MLFHAAIKEASRRPKGGCFFLLILLSLSFFVGAAGILSFSLLLIGDIHDDRETLWLRDADNNNNMRGQVKEDASITESSSANETSTLSDNERLIVKMEDLLKSVWPKKIHNSTKS